TTFGSGNINFELAEFENTDLLFESVDFGQGNVSFHSSTFNDLSLKSCHLDNYFDLRVAKCNHLDLSDTIVRDIIDLQPYKSEVKIQFFDISGMRLIGRIDVDWHANRVYSMIAGQEFTTYREKAEQFRTLKENYGNTGQYTYEDLAYIQFKRYEQKADLHDSLDRNRSSAIWQYPFYFLKSLLFDKMGLYATSPVRVLLSLFIVYLTISMIYFVCPYIFESTYINCITEEMSFLDRLFTTLYYSLITFATVGYGDCSPVGFLRFFAAIEGIIGVYMMSYFTVAFARKILR
ncbi:MAG: potassium channel family protein, partial [Bacteroidetes bacterium]|nr:potassium channel family protein [Bacteroidota bacterium]